MSSQVPKRKTAENNTFPNQQGSENIGSGYRHQPEQINTSPKKTKRGLGLVSSMVPRSKEPEKSRFRTGGVPKTLDLGTEKQPKQANISPKKTKGDLVLQIYGKSSQAP